MITALLKLLSSLFAWWILSTVIVWILFQGVKFIFGIPEGTFINEFLVSVAVATWFVWRTG